MAKRDPIYTKAFKADFFDYETGIVEGYASTFGNIDKANDVVQPGAFKTAVLQGPERVRFLWEHDRKEIIGGILEMREDAKGLWIKARFGSSQRAQETRANMRDGFVDSFSIGYRVIQEKKGRIGQKSVNFLQEIQLLEVSCVAWPCNVEARMTGIKGELDERFAELNLEQQSLIHKFIDFLESETKSEIIIIEATPDQVSEVELEDSDVVCEDENVVVVVVEETEADETSESITGSKTELEELAAKLKMVALAAQLKALH